jgi:hypothetical protein
MRIRLLSGLLAITIAPPAAAQGVTTNAPQTGGASFFEQLPARFWSHSNQAAGWQLGVTAFSHESSGRYCPIVGDTGRDDILYFIKDLDSLQLGDTIVPPTAKLDSVLANPDLKWHAVDVGALKATFKGCS